MAPAVHPGLFLIMARAANGTIGRDGTMPWHLPADLKRFKALTMGPDGLGRPMIMGRKTFDSLPGLLPGRRHVVLTRQAEWQAEGAEVTRSVDQALTLAGPGVVAVIGGAEVYRLFLPRAERIELTQIDAEYAGDTAIDAPGSDWREVSREQHAGFAFLTYLRADTAA